MLAGTKYWVGVDWMLAEIMFEANYPVRSLFVCQSRGHHSQESLHTGQDCVPGLLRWHRVIVG